MILIARKSFPAFPCFLRLPQSQNQKGIKVVMAARSHLFPFRTEKLSSLSPMVLNFGRVGSRRFQESISTRLTPFLCLCGAMAVETLRATSLHFCVCGNARCRDCVHTVSTTRGRHKRSSTNQERSPGGMGISTPTFCLKGNT